uniref:(northern house mosquito) hypothetical protein n=1 Tax=Culex pipiens TaxID=7175 RepID=A0A8D8FUV4_CULPI
MFSAPSMKLLLPSRGLLELPSGVPLAYEDDDIATWFRPLNRTLSYKKKTEIFQLFARCSRWPVSGMESGSHRRRGTVNLGQNFGMQLEWIGTRRPDQDRLSRS